MNLFYDSGTVEKKSRSRMNAPFRIASLEGDQELEKQFIEEAAAKDMIQLKGHRLVYMHIQKYTSIPIMFCLSFVYLLSKQ